MDRLAEACERVAATNSRLKKVAVLAGYLATLCDADLVRAIRFLRGQRLKVGYTALREAVIQVTGWDEETLRVCYREVGDSGETISLLLQERTENESLSLAQAETLYRILATTRTSAGKIKVLASCFSRYRPLAIRYFIKVLTGGLRIGLQEKILEEALARSCGAPVEDVRAANNRFGDLEHVALAARHNRLHEVGARLFHPMEFMLAQPLNSVDELENPSEWVVEDKYDGIRAQIHIEGGRVAIYSRGFDDVTRSYPEVVEAMGGVRGSAILDGELLAWKDGRALPFQLLQQRLARKSVTAEILLEAPVAFIAYDLLYRDGELLIDRPLAARRAALEALPVNVSEQRPADSHERIEEMFRAARANANEGLVLKRHGSLYEAGRRGGAWKKLKRPFATLDVVITAAEQGHGKRAMVLSDYTFAVRDGEEFPNVGKAYSGLTDNEIKVMTRLLRSLAVERFGRVILVRPQVVLEVAFDGIQKSPRHKSGYALRFPRIVRWRRDKMPADIDTLARVRELYGLGRTDA